MVITVFWKPSWIVPIICISILCIAVKFLLCCFCIQRKRKETLKLGLSPKRKFLDFSNASLNRIMFFRNCDLNKNGLAQSDLPRDEEKPESEPDLLETEDFSKRFHSSYLKIDETDDDESIKSCNSADSRYTFFSIYPGVSRSASNGSDSATYKSARNSLVKIPEYDKPNSL